MDGRDTVDPVSLIVVALAAGAQSAASEALTDAHADLKRVVSRLFGGRGSGQEALERHELQPERWRAALEAELVAVDAAQHPEVLVAAQRVTELVEAEGPEAGRCVAPGIPVVPCMREVDFGLPGEPSTPLGNYYVCPREDEDVILLSIPAEPPLCPVHGVPMILQQG
jgi:hypothetical protein